MRSLIEAHCRLMKFGGGVRTSALGSVVFRSRSPATGFDCVGAELSRLIRSSHGPKFDDRRIEKSFEKNRTLRKLLLRKNIRRKFAAKIRLSFQLFLEVALLFDCARRIASPCWVFSREGKRAWKRPASGRIGRRKALRGPRGRSLRGSRGARLRRRVRARAHASTGCKWQKAGSCYVLL